MRFSELAVLTIVLVGMLILRMYMATIPEAAAFLDLATLVLGWAVTFAFIWAVMSEIRIFKRKMTQLLFAIILPTLLIPTGLLPVIFLGGGVAIIGMLAFVAVLMVVMKFARKPKPRKKAKIETEAEVLVKKKKEQLKMLGYISKQIEDKEKALTETRQKVERGEMSPGSLTTLTDSITSLYKQRDFIKTRIEKINEDLKRLEEEEEKRRNKGNDLFETLRMK